MRRTRRILIYCLISAIISALLLEGALRFVDPAGVYRYFADFTDLMALSVPAPDGYRFVPGYHSFRQYHAVIGVDGLRGVPGSDFEPCRIAFVGDSVTFGMGADLSFVDALATDIDATVINAGLPGYSAANVLAQLNTIEADGYIWLIVQNDDEPLYRWRRGSGYVPSALNLYLGWWFPGSGGGTLNDKRFQANAALILARDDVQGFAFKGAGLTNIVEREYPQVEIIPQYAGHVSRFDAHPDETGAAEIAAAMRSTVIEFTARRCNGVN